MLLCFFDAFLPDDVLIPFGWFIGLCISEFYWLGAQELGFSATLSSVADGCIHRHRRLRRAS